MCTIYCIVNCRIVIADCTTTFGLKVFWQATSLWPPHAVIEHVSQSVSNLEIWDENRDLRDRVLLLQSSSSIILRFLSMRYFLSEFDPFLTILVSLNLNAFCVEDEKSLKKMGNSSILLLTYYAQISTCFGWLLRSHGKC